MGFCAECDKFLQLPGSAVVCRAGKGGMCERTRDDPPLGPVTAGTADRIAVALERIAEALERLPAVAPKARTCGVVNLRDKAAVCVLPAGHELPHQERTGLHWGFPQVPEPRRMCGELLPASLEHTGGSASCSRDAGHDGMHADKLRGLAW